MPNNMSMNVRSFFGILIGVIVLLGVAYYIGQQSSKKDALAEYNQVFDKYQDSVVKPMLIKSDSLKRLADSTKSVADSAQSVANKQTSKITELRGTVAVLRKQNAALSDSVLTDTVEVPTVCDQCRRAVVQLNVEVDSLNKVVVQQEVRDTTRQVTIKNLNTSLLVSNARGDSLQTVIVNFPAPPKPNKFLGMTLPRIPSQYVVLGAVAATLIIAK